MCGIILLYKIKRHAFSQWKSPIRDDLGADWVLSEHFNYNHLKIRQGLSFILD